MENYGNLSLLASFAGGAAAFASPCILPLIPAFLSFISSASVENLNKKSFAVFARTIFFVLGFSAVFIILGMSASKAGMFLGENIYIFRNIGGVIVIVLGLHVAGAFKIKFLNFQFSASGKTPKALSSAGAFAAGCAFAFGWTPCVGPILASILFLASNEADVWKGFRLLSAFSAGLALPFILSALLFNKMMRLSNFIKKHYRTVEICSGVLLIGVGVLLITGGFTKITAFFLTMFNG